LYLRQGPKDCVSFFNWF